MIFLHVFSVSFCFFYSGLIWIVFEQPVSKPNLLKRTENEVNNQITNIKAVNVLKIWKTHAWIERLVLAHLSKST